MIIAQTTALIKRAAKLTGLSEKSILRRTRDRQVNAVRAAIFQALLDLGHTRNRIAEAFGCDAKTVQWALDHPGENTSIITHQLNSSMPYQDCGSGQEYGICPQCNKGHGYIAKESRGVKPFTGPTAPAIGLRYSR